MAGLLCTRTLYDKEMLQAIRMSNGLSGRPDNANLITGATSDVPPSDGTADATAAGFTSIDIRAAGGDAAGGDAAAAASSDKPGATSRGAELCDPPRRRGYFRPPPLSCARCTRALFAIFVGLTRATPSPAPACTCHMHMYT